MRLRKLVQFSLLPGCALAAASPALAGDEHGNGASYPDRWRGPAAELSPEVRDAWLADCRHRLSARDRGVGGAVIGGVIGGFAGNRIAGRGDRTVGTIAGAAVGAAAGMAIDKAEDNGRVRDECEAYLDDYYASYRQPYSGYSYGYGYGQAYPGYGYYGYPAAAYGAGCCAQAVPVMPRAEPQCTETVEYEYEDVPVYSRPARPQKRVKVVPDKRIKVQ